MGKFYSLPPSDITDRKGRGNFAIRPQNGISSLSVEDVRLEEMGSLRDILKDLTMKVDILMEAIDSAHMRGPDGVCREDCWSCRVSETIQGIRVARKLGVKE